MGEENFPALSQTWAPLRMRANEQLRACMAETKLHASDFILPLFVREPGGGRRPIPSLPGHAQLPLDLLAEEVEAIAADGVSALLLFGVPSSKDRAGSASYREGNLIERALRLLRERAPQLLLIADCCLCSYTDHGHCALLKEGEGHEIDLEATLEALGRQALSWARAGADLIAPSSMMDGQVAALRRALDRARLSTPILSYAAKYASSFYGPFRQAAECAPQWGDRSHYQMDIRNGEEALREIALDLQEGADMVMVKPAHTYLDVIARARRAFPTVPIAAYHTSGEYAMLCAAAAQGWIDERRALLEVFTAIKRAGAQRIITYGARQAVRWC